jgi:hypothetical protein
MPDFSVFNLPIIYFLLFLDQNNPQIVSALNKTAVLFSDHDQWSYVCAKLISITDDNTESYPS